MRLSSLDFEGCGFPEEYFFFSIMVLTVTSMITFVAVHFLVDEEYFRQKIRLPVVFHLFNAKAFTTTGNIARIVLVVSLSLLALALVALPYLYEYEIFVCGRLGT